MKKFIYLCFIFLLFGCSPAEKNSYIPPLKFVNISNEIEINKDQKEELFKKIKLMKSKKIGILTSGGDCGGLNADIRSIFYLSLIHI